MWTEQEQIYGQLGGSATEEKQTPDNWEQALFGDENPENQQTEPAISKYDLAADPPKPAKQETASAPSREITAEKEKPTLTPQNPDEQPVPINVVKETQPKNLQIWEIDAKAEKALNELGFDDSDIHRVKPEILQKILDGKITKEQWNKLQEFSKSVYEGVETKPAPETAGQTSEETVPDPELPTGNDPKNLNPLEKADLLKLKEEIGEMPQEEKNKIEFGIRHFDLWIKERKENFFARILKNTADFLKDKNKLASSTFSEWQKLREDNLKTTRDQWEKLKSGKTGVLGRTWGLTGATLFYGRMVRDIFGSTAVSPFRLVLAGFKTASEGMDSLKNARMKSEELIEKNRQNDMRTAEEEAINIYERAEKSKLEKGDIAAPSKEELQKAYEENRPKDLIDRLSMDYTPMTASNLLQSFIKWDLRKSVERIDKKLNEIDGDNSLNPENKEIKKARVLIKYRRHLEDVDAMTSHYGVVDGLALLAKTGTTAAKAGTFALFGETAGLLVYKLWDSMSNIMSSSEDFGEKITDIKEKIKELAPDASARTTFETPATGIISAENAATIQPEIISGDSQPEIQRAEISAEIAQEITKEETPPKEPVRIPVTELKHGEETPDWLSTPATPAEIPEITVPETAGNTAQPETAQTIQREIPPQTLPDIKPEVIPEEPETSAPPEQHPSENIPPTITETQSNIRPEEPETALAQETRGIKSTLSIELGKNGMPLRPERIVQTLALNHWNNILDANGSFSEEYAAKSVNVTANIMRLLEGKNTLGINAEEFKNIAGWNETKNIFEIKNPEEFNRTLDKFIEHSDKLWSKGTLQTNVLQYLNGINKNTWGELIKAEDLNKILDGNSGILGHQGINHEQISDFSKFAPPPSVPGKTFAEEMANMTSPAETSHINDTPLQTPIEEKIPEFSAQIPEEEKDLSTFLETGGKMPEEINPAPAQEQITAAEEIKSDIVPKNETEQPAPETVTATHEDQLKKQFIINQFGEMVETSDLEQKAMAMVAKNFGFTEKEYDAIKKVTVGTLLGNIPREKEDEWLLWNHFAPKEVNLPFDEKGGHDPIEFRKQVKMAQFIRGNLNDPKNPGNYVNQMTVKEFMETYAAGE